MESSHQQHFLRLLIAAVPGLLLLAGLWTPYVGAVTVIIGLRNMFLGTGDPCSELQLTIVSAALAMLGPGAWSVDARLFGRKRIDLLTSRTHNR
jgi:putative oxidoreductase